MEAPIETVPSLVDILTRKNIPIRAEYRIMDFIMKYKRISIFDEIGSELNRFCLIIFYKDSIQKKY